MKFICILYLFNIILLSSTLILSIKIEDANALKALYSRLKSKMEQVDNDFKINKSKKNDIINLQMESKAATTAAPVKAPNVRSPSFILNNILNTPLGNRLK